MKRCAASSATSHATSTASFSAAPVPTRLLLDNKRSIGSATWTASGASCRTPTDRTPTGPTSPSTIPARHPSGRAASQAHDRRCVTPGTTSSSCRGARRRSGSTTAAGGTARPGRTASHPTRARHGPEAGRVVDQRLPNTTASITVCQSQLESSATSAPTAMTADLHRRPSPRPRRQPRTAPTRSADPARSTSGDTSGNAIVACATPTGPAGRTPADRPARPRGRHDDAPRVDTRRPLTSAVGSRRATTPATRRHRPHSRRAGRPAAHTCA